MSTSSMAMVFGVVFLLVGVLGFFPAPPPPDAPPLTIEQGHGLLLGLFPINILHNAVHLLFGILGLAAAYGALMTARSYFVLVAVSYALLTLMGLLPVTRTTFGLVPIWGNDIWLHALLAAAAAYFAFIMPAATPRRVP